MKYNLLLIAITFNFLTVFSQWTQIGSDIDGVAEDDMFGFSVDISDDGNIIAVGARDNNDIGGEYEQPGHVRVFQNISGNWVQLGNTIYDLPKDYDYTTRQRFGWDVSLSSDGFTLIVGKSSDIDFEVYKYSGDDWVKYGSTIFQDFDNPKAVSISSDGNTIAYMGSIAEVNIMRYNNGTWTRLGSVIEGGVYSFAYHPSLCLSADGSVLAVGDHDQGEFHNGLVRVYKYEDEDWVQLGRDFGSNSGDNQYYGNSVSLSADGSVLAIGAPSAIDLYSEVLTSFASVYKYESGQWNLIGDHIYEEAYGDRFGWEVSLSNDGSILAVSGHRNDDAGVTAGHVRVFQNLSGVWTQLGGDVDGESSGDQFGFSVSLSGDGQKFVVGARWSDDAVDNAGQARVYKYDVLLSNNSIQLKDNFNVRVEEGVIIVDGDSYSDLNLYSVDGKEIENNNLNHGVYILQVIVGENSAFAKKVVVN